MENKYEEYFAPVIGYEGIKRDLYQVLDIMHHPEVYEPLGVRVPTGILLDGEPGVGKSLMSKCFIAASGRYAVTCRRNMPKGDFTRFIQESFRDAAEHSPAIILLDDMDKFANEDNQHPNAEEYVSVQSCIDEYKDKDVFVLATTNDTRSLPDSLLRAGRFDRLIRVSAPEGKEAEQIIRHYLDQKRVCDDIDVSEIAHILSGDSCAKLEALINIAGLLAGYERRDKICMQDIINAYMSSIRNVPICALTETPKRTPLLERIACHEAGHILLHELFEPGTVTLASIFGGRFDQGGFTSFCSPEYLDMQQHGKNLIMACLGGRAAVEVVYGIIDFGASNDLRAAAAHMGDLVMHCGMSGIGYTEAPCQDSEWLLQKQQQEAASQLENYYSEVKQLISKNRETLERIRNALLTKRTLRQSEIRAILDVSERDAA